MWRTGEIAGYRWEAIINNNTVVKIALHKGAAVVQPNRFMMAVIMILARLGR